MAKKTHPAVDGSEVLQKSERWLSCALTVKELVAKRELLVEWTKLRAEREDALEVWKGQKREEQKLYEAEILAAGATLVRTARCIEEEKEMRDVKVTEYIQGSTVSIVREDTGELISERPATDGEQQRTLPSE